jgi:hypothetical protein
MGRRNTDSRGREDFGGLCAHFETKAMPSPDFSARSELLTSAFPGLIYSFCAALHVSPPSAIDLAEASLRQV